MQDTPFPGAPAEPAREKNTPAQAGFVLGLCAILGWLLPAVGLPLTITGIVLSAIGLNRASRGGAHKARAAWGLGLNIAFLCLSLGNAIVGAVVALHKIAY